VPPGVLTLTVSPDGAQVWLDGREAAVGTATVSGLLPGLHEGVVTAVGYERRAVAIQMRGAGQLETQTVVLKPWDGPNRRGEILQFLRDALGTPREISVVRQAVLGLGADAVVLVRGGESPAPTGAAWRHLTVKWIG